MLTLFSIASNQCGHPENSKMEVALFQREEAILSVVRFPLLKAN